MSLDSSTLSDGSSNLYSLEDLRRFGPSTRDGPYTLDELGHMLSCLSVSVGGTFSVRNASAYTHSTPLLVKPVLLFWPEDQPQPRSQVGRLQAAPFCSGLQHWVIAEKASILPRTVTGTVADGVTQTIWGDSVLKTSSPAPYEGALCTPASPPEVERMTLQSTSATSTSLMTSQPQPHPIATTSICRLLSLPSPPFMTPPPAPSFLSSPGGARVDMHDPSLDQYGSGVEHWYAVTTERAIGVFEDSGVASQTRQRRESYALATEAFHEHE